MKYNQTAAQLASTATILSSVNVLVLMPAARHENAGLFTQALPVVFLAFALVLVYMAGQHLRNNQA